MKKVCNYCGLERDAENDFSWEFKSRGIRHKRCKFCQQELSKRHYQNNTDDYRNRDKISKGKGKTVIVLKPVSVAAGGALLWSRTGILRTQLTKLYY